MRTRFLLSLAFLILGLGALEAQTKRTKYYEFGVQMGTLNMNNDIATTNRVNAVFQEMTFQGGIFAKYHLNDWFGLGAEMNYGVLEANDANHDNFTRGFSVQTSLVNANLFTEIHFIRFGKYHMDDKFTVYLKGGLGVAGWNPEFAFETNIPENVQIESNSYSGMTYFGGFGAKYRLSYNSIIGLETRFNSVSGDTMDGFILMDGDNSNDGFWGVKLFYSYAIL